MVKGDLNVNKTDMESKSVVVPRPSFPSWKANEDGGICLDREDTKAFLKYQDDVERALGMQEE